MPARLAFVWAIVFALPSVRANQLAPQAGTTVVVEIELSEQLRRIAGERQLSPVTHARATFAFPNNYDPAQTWPLLLVQATADPDLRSSRDLAALYAPIATRAGWIVVAADPQPTVAPHRDTAYLRYALSRAALEALGTALPASKDFPFALAGFSGGAKTVGHLAAFFARDGRLPIGLFQAGINRETVADSGWRFGVRNKAYTDIPVFLLVGTADQISTVKQHQLVQRDLTTAGFRHVRLETFAGAHVIAIDRLEVALNWFRDLAQARGQWGDPTFATDARPLK